MIIKLRERVKPVKTPESIHHLILNILKEEHEVDRQKEHFWSIGLNSKNKIKYIEMVSLGILNASLVHPRELFRLAISRAAASIIVAHNHPSGDPEPSEEDISMTKRIVESGKILGIEVLDHVIVCSRQYKSFKELGHM